MADFAFDVIGLGYSTVDYIAVVPHLVGGAKFASVTAALKCTKLGGRAGIPAYADVVRLLD